jgi:hypothetical protein
MFKIKLLSSRSLYDGKYLSDRTATFLLYYVKEGMYEVYREEKTMLGDDSLVFAREISFKEICQGVEMNEWKINDENPKK